MSAYVYGQSRRNLRPVIVTEEYDDPALCARRIRAYRGSRGGTCARRKGHGGAHRPAEFLATWGGKYKPRAVAADGRCRTCGYVPGSPSCQAECGGGS